MELLLGRIFIRELAEEFELSNDECFELLHPLYCLRDTGDSWAATLTKHLTNDIGLIPSCADPFFMFKREDDGA